MRNGIYKFKKEKQTMQDRFKFRVYFKGSEYAKAGYVDLTRSDVIFSLRADGRIIRTVVYECQQEEHKGEPCNISFTPNNNLYDIQFCTGLKDKHGKLIYDKDLIRYNENVFRVNINLLNMSLTNILNSDIIVVDDSKIFNDSEVIGNEFECNTKI